MRQEPEKEYQNADWDRRRRNLRVVMAYKGWKESTLSQESGLGKNAVSNFLNGDSLPKFDTLERICVTLGLNNVSMLDAENPISEIRNELFGVIQALGEDQAKAALARLYEAFPDLRDLRKESAEGK